MLLTIWFCATAMLVLAVADFRTLLIALATLDSVEEFPRYAMR